jgi:two-component system cell cycle response regulator DivK
MTSMNNIEDGKKGTILVAEDNDSNYLLVYAILKKYTTIIRAINGVEAVEKAKTGSADLILMDIKMPVMDGLDATTEIRKFNPEIPIIALTANAFDSDRERALGVGCNDFLTKPLRKSDLIAIIEKWGGDKFAF